MAHEIDNKIIECIRDEWKSAPEIAKELNENRVRIYNRLKQMRIRNEVAFKYGVEAERKAPLVYHFLEGD